MYVELRNAYVWNCPSCDCRNIVEKFANVIEEQQSENDNGDTFELVTMEVGPIHDGTVICDNCEAYHEVEPPPPLIGGE